MSGEIGYNEKELLDSMTVFIFDGMYYQLKQGTSCSDCDILKHCKKKFCEILGERNSWNYFFKACPGLNDQTCSPDVKKISLNQWIENRYPEKFNGVIAAIKLLTPQSCYQRNKDYTKTHLQSQTQNNPDGDTEEQLLVDIINALQSGKYTIDSAEVQPFLRSLFLNGDGNFTDTLRKAFCHIFDKKHAQTPKLKICIECDHYAGSKKCSYNAPRDWITGEYSLTDCQKMRTLDCGTEAQFFVPRTEKECEKCISYFLIKENKCCNYAAAYFRRAGISSPDLEEISCKIARSQIGVCGPTAREFKQK